MKEIDYFREFTFEHGRCQSYFDLMYKTLQFTFAAIITVFGIAFGFLSDKAEYAALMFFYILPVCLYVFGVMYAYNAYALAVCGKRAEILHKKVYCDVEETDEATLILKKYVNSSRFITLISYGVPLGFYFVIPLASILYSLIECKVKGNIFFYEILPFILLAVYYLIMIIIIVKIIRPYGAINKIQQGNPPEEAFNNIEEILIVENNK